jgi:transcriptional regulator with XRE-family HTH domain
MTLDEYLVYAGVTAGEFAQRLGCSVQTIYKYRRNQRFPNREVQRQIYELTGGKVTPNDWVGVGQLMSPVKAAPVSVSHHRS